MSEEAVALKRPALRYYGGKWRLAPWIIRHFPDHQCYCEPFAGSAAVLLRKPASQFEIYNDLDGAMVAFFKLLRERPEELIHQLNLTPYSRAEYNLAYEPSSDDMEKARRLFVLAWQGFGGPRKQMRTGWKYQRRAWHSGRADQITEWLQARQLLPIVERLSAVQFENDDALRVIHRFDSEKTLFYCDPPYPADTRNQRWSKSAYTFEINGEDHYHLCNVLKKIKGFAVISTYPNDLYEELFADWIRKERTAQTMNKSIGREVLYISPRTADALSLR